MKPGSFVVVPSARKSQWIQNEKQDILSKHHLAFYSVGDGGWAHVAQKGFGLLDYIPTTFQH